jgi:putative addiction module component (TIGR02574 family)
MIPRYNPSMPHTFEEVRQIAYELPTEQRILLANSLWESVDTEECDASEAEIEAAWGEEVKHRLDEIDSGAVKLIPHEEFVADLDAHIASKR